MESSKVRLGHRARDASPFGLDMVAIMVIALSDYAPRWRIMGDFALTWHTALPRERNLSHFAPAWHAMDNPATPAMRHTPRRNDGITPLSLRITPQASSTPISEATRPLRAQMTSLSTTQRSQPRRQRLL